MEINYLKIKNIIFDLGNVIVDHDINKTWKYFVDKGFSIEKYPEVSRQLVVDNTKLELGVITTEEFFRRAENLINHEDLKAEEIEYAFNVLFSPIPRGRIELLNNVRKHYKTFFLSNTHEPHIRYLTEKSLSEHNVKSFHDLVDKVYFSHELHLRKPDLNIYEYVLVHENLKPEETLFIDDRMDNIEAAQQLGIQAFFLDIDNGVDVRNLFYDGIFRPAP